MKKICDTEELRKALVQADLFQFIFAINGEDQQQFDGKWLHACEIILKPNVPEDKNQAIATIFVQQQQRDWRAWRIAMEQINKLEQESGLSRKDREFAKALPEDSYYRRSADMVELQIESLRPELSKTLSVKPDLQVVK